MWRKIDLNGCISIPKPRFYHKTIKYKHYAIIFGGNEDDDLGYMYDFWFINLNTFQCTKWFDSKIISHIFWDISTHNSQPQLINDDILIYKDSRTRYVYWINLSKFEENTENNKNHNSKLDWNRLNVSSSYDYAVSNNNCLVLFNRKSFKQKQFSMLLCMNPNENEQYSINFKENDDNLDKRFENIINVENSSNYNDSSSKPCFWLNNRVALVDHKDKALYCTDDIKRMVFTAISRNQWKIIRLLWIAYLKNEKTDKCLFNNLSKDIVKYVIKFIADSYSTI